MTFICKDTFIIKKSKFIAYLYQVHSLEEVKTVLQQLKLEHKKAKHFPYAYILSNTAGKSDDKEPSNTAGLPIFNLLERKKKTDCLLVVVRYFGGVKLGTGGLFRAYLTAASLVLEEKN